MNTEGSDQLAHTLVINCGRALAQAVDEQDLLQSVCNTLVKNCGFRLAWFGYTEPDSSNSIRLVAQAGDQDGFLNETGCSETPAIMAIEDGETCWIKAIADSPLVVPIRAAALERGYTSVLSLPLKSDSTLFGALTIYADDPGKLDEPIVERLRQWSDLFALRVKTLRLHEERDLNNDLQNTAARQRLENRLRLIIDTTPALIHTSRPDGYLDYFNKRWVEYLGVPLEDVEGWKWTASVHPDDVAGIVDKWRACLASGEIFEYETRVRRADGEYRRMLHRKVPLRDEHGKILKWYGSSMDIEDYKRAEEQLRRSAEELQRSESYLAEGQRLAHMGSWAFDAAGFDYWSPELFRMHGLEPASKAPTVQEYLDCVHPQDREFMANLIKGVLAEASSFDATKRIVRPDGEVRYIRCVGTPVVENQALKKYVGSAIDVTEYELLTLELHRREAYLTEAQRLSHTGSFGWRPASGEIVWSDETYRIFEYDRAVKPTIDLMVQRVHPEDRVDFHDVIDRASRGATHFEHAYRLLLPDRRVKHVHALAHALEDASGNCEFVGAVMDVSERKRAEEAVLRSEKELRNVIETIPISVWTALPDGTIDFVSRHWREHSGLSGEGPYGAGWQTAVHPEDIDRHLEKWRASLATGAPFENEARRRAADGEYRWFLARAVPLRDEQGNILKWYGITMEIDDRKRAEEAFRTAQIELAHVTRVATLGEMTASIAHEINQPLGALVNNAGACLGWLDAENLEEARNSVGLVMDDAQRASEIITRIRALVKKASPQKDWLDINQTIREVIGLGQSEVQRNHVALETQLSDDMPLVFADRIQLQQVMLNLMMNAIEAMTQVTTPRELLISSGADDSKGVVVIVRDSGAGLDSKSLERLFEPFYTTKPQGMGMGLAICRSIMQAHGGRLWAATNRDRGASFHFSLPTGEEME